jgi:hypothetical protein
MNIVLRTKNATVDSVGTHRSTDPAAGSFTYHHGYGFSALDDIDAGEELIMSCSVGQVPPKPTSAIRPSRTIAWLEDNGVCIDGLSVGPSTLPGAGRGAFSKRSVEVGETLVFSPVVHFDRSLTMIFEQKHSPGHAKIPMREHGIEYTSNLKGHQLVLNYCYSHPDSNVMLLPYAPGVNYINHDRERANVYVRWSNEDWVANHTEYFDYLQYDLFTR